MAKCDKAYVEYGKMFLRVPNGSSNNGGSGGVGSQWRIILLLKGFGGGKFNEIDFGTERG